MNISYYLEGKKELASIYIRMRDTTAYAKAPTGLKILKKHFKNGSVKLLTTPKNTSTEIKQQVIKQNNNLTALQNKLNTIKEKVTNAFNQKQEYEIINTEWLKNILKPNPKTETPKTLVAYFDYYMDFKKKSIKASTIKKMNVFKNRLINYQKDLKKTVYIQDVNKQFSFSMQKWCDDNGYAHNTKVKTIKVILTICNFASENGTPTSNELKYITKGLKYKDSTFITLSFDEIQQIADTKILDERLSIAKDWLIISCYTAQRVSDNLYLKKENIIYQNGGYFLQIKQEKTDNPVNITLNDEVVKILNKRNGHFPPVFSDNKDSNEIIYNKLIKEVCRIAKINEMVLANIKNKKTNRYEIKEVPKYKAVTSHIGRRSFATNYQPYINPTLLREQTGHKTEVQFLRYVSKTKYQNSLQLAKEMRKVDKQLKELKTKKNKAKIVHLSSVN